MRSSKKQKKDILLLILFPVVASLLSLVLKTNFLISTLLFFGLPSVWLSCKNREAIAKSLIFSFLSAVPLTIIIDYIGVLDQSWYVFETLFPFRILGLIPMEDFVWGFLLIYSVVMFYEHFFDKTGRELVDRRIKYFVWFLSLLSLLFFTVLFIKPALLNVKYAYFWLGLILAFIPAVTFLSFFPQLLSKYVKTGAYFFLLAILLELTGLHLGHWGFSGSHFIGWVELFGLKFPFEEFFFFFLISSVSILSYYEFFDDDRK